MDPTPCIEPLGQYPADPLLSFLPSKGLPYVCLADLSPASLLRFPAPPSQNREALSRRRAALQRLRQPRVPCSLEPDIPF